ncbi:MAG: CAP domain-containing protein [Nitrosarchaeum sp.]|nr:CAP domain-containing protein [Nitrosarchaeum sp.]
MIVVAIIIPIISVISVFVLFGDDIQDFEDTEFKPIIKDISEDIPDKLTVITEQSGDIVTSIKDNIETLNKPEFDEQVIEMFIYELTNEQRRNHGVKELVLDPALSLISKHHSEDMVKRSYYSHYSPEGYEPSDRARQSNYECVKDYGSYYTEGISENIASGWLYSSYSPNILITKYVWLNNEEIASELVDGWMNSKDHRENILSVNYDSIGIGISISDNDEVLATQNFC